MKHLLFEKMNIIYKFLTRLIRQKRKDMNYQYQKWYEELSNQERGNITTDYVDTKRIIREYQLNITKLHDFYQWTGFLKNTNYQSFLKKRQVT